MEKKNWNDEISFNTRICKAPADTHKHSPSKDLFISRPRAECCRRQHRLIDTYPSVIRRRPSFVVVLYPVLRPSVVRHPSRRCPSSVPSSSSSVRPFRPSVVRRPSCVVVHLQSQGRIQFFRKEAFINKLPVLGLLQPKNQSNAVQKNYTNHA